jgi:replicative DNA helicase
MNIAEQHENIIKFADELLGMIINKHDLFWLIADKVQPDNFPTEKQKKVWFCINELAKNNKQIDILTVTENASFWGFDVGGPAGVIELTNTATEIPTQSHSLHLCQVLKEYSVRWRLRNLNKELTAKVEDVTKHPVDLLQEIQLTCDNISENVFSGQDKSLGDVATEMLESMERAYKNDGQTGINIFGITELDWFLQGGEPGDLIIVAGRPGQGKSSLQNSALLHFVKNKIPGLFWSLEMPNRMTYARLVSAITGIPYTDLVKKAFDESRMAEVYRAIDMINESGIVMEDKTSLNPLDLKARVASMKHKGGCDGVFVDRLGLMKSMPGLEKANKTERLGETTGFLKRTAQELELPFIVHSQLSRAVDARPDRRPQLSDLRDSGHIEQDATKVLMLYRPEYYGFMDNGDNMNFVDYAGKGIGIIAKNRNGKTGDVMMDFKAPQTLFTNEGYEFGVEPDPANNAITNNRPDDNDIVPF